MDRINNKGWIALDIDGTVTDALHEMPFEVCAYLKKVVLEGWKVMFVTGRTFSFAYSVLKSLDFSYYVAVQNGSDILKMPERRLVSRCYFSADIFPSLEKAYEGFEEDFIIYAGYENQDFCYYRPGKFSAPYLDYLLKLKTLTPSQWKEVENFKQIAQKEFPLVKCFGKKEPMQALNTKLQKMPQVHATLIHDTVSVDLYLILITAPYATKGFAVDRVRAHENGAGLLIAAGNDTNDLPMLEKADVRIVIKTAPQEMLERADIIAAPPSECGIIAALEMATLIKR